MFECKCRDDIKSIEKEVVNGEKIDIDRMQPIGFFYPISLEIIEAIYTENKILTGLKIIR